MSRITKGPWEFHLGIDYACVMGVGQLPDTAFCRLYGASREVEANGRLIAAAPELLAACELVDKWLMQPWSEADAEGPAVHPAFRKALKAVRAAIAKAEAR